MNDALDRLWRALEGGSSWRGTAGIVAAFLVLGLMRRFLSPEGRSRTHVPAWFLITALIFRTCAWLMSGTASGGGAASVFGLLAVLCLVVGLVGLAGLVVFDLILRRYPIPSVVRDFAQAIVVALIVVGTLHQYGFDPISLARPAASSRRSSASRCRGRSRTSSRARPAARRRVLDRRLDRGGGHTGRIREIKWRSTTLVTKDGDTVVVPNNQLIAASVKNYSRPTTAHRMWIDLAFHYRHPPNEVRPVVLPPSGACPACSPSPRPTCS
jgi:hypothetical protein